VDLPQLPAVELPESWVAAASAAGQTVANTSDIIPAFMEGIVNLAPELLSDLTPEMWRALDPAAVIIALPEVAESLDVALLAQLQAIQLSASGTIPEPVPLPDSWIAAASAGGFSLETTADVPAEAIGQLAGFAPQLLDDLTEEVLLSFAPDVLAELPDEYVAGLDDGLQQTINSVVIVHAQYMAATAGEEETDQAAEVDPGRLPEALIQGARAAGQEIEFAQDVEPDFIRILSSFGEQGIQFLAMLTADNLRLLPTESIALLPSEFLDTLDADLRVELDERAVEFGGAGELAIVEAEAADPARLPEALIRVAGEFGVDLEVAQDITPEFIRPIAAAGPQASQLFEMLTPDHLRLLQPEVIALLPADFLDTLDGDLRAELDELAAEFGGAGQLAIAEAEAAAAASADSPPLTGPWVEPGPDGEASLFQTAGDLLNNTFVGSAAGLLNVFPESPNVENPVEWMQALSPEVMAYLAENEEEFVENLSPVILEMMSAETLTFLLDSYPEAFETELEARLRGIAAGSIEVFVPEASITRTDGNPSVSVNLFKDGDANTVEVAHRVFDELAAFTEENPDISTNLVFEQATFIEDSIEGVAREGALGAVFAVIVILIFLSGHVGGRYKLSWRATLVTGTSIPLSVFAAFLLMRGVPTVGLWLQGMVEGSGNGILTFFSRLFPTSVTLNIMTLSGMTVAIGRVVDDSIVVLENSYRFIQRGDDPRHAVIQGTKEVAIAIFSATATTVAVFMPLGLVGGIIGSFFLPFGLTVTYALAASFVVSITVVPALTYLLIRREHIPEERETTMQRWYTPILRWALGHRFYTMVIATGIFLGSLFLLRGLPQSFIPAIGEPTINIGVSLPNGALMADTNELVLELEEAIKPLDGVETIQTEVGSGGGFESLFGGGGVSQNVASVSVSVHEQENLIRLTNEIRSEAEAIFGVENVSVSAASQTGFGGFSMTVAGDSAEQLRELVDDVKAAIGSVDIDGNGIPDIANVSSNVDNGDAATGGANTIIRIDGRPAVSFSGELETENTLGVTNVAKQAINDIGLPAGYEVTEGFESQQQVEGFRSMVIAIGYSILIVYAIMALTFRSLIHPFTILFSLPFALAGAALALFVSNSVLGISAMIGMMMLVGIVVTNGIVLMELVQQLRRRGQNAYDALVQGGRTRLRPIWMTALAAILALLPLGLSQEAGAIIASELALVVMGGLLVSTALTLVVIPVLYSAFDQLGNRIRRQFARRSDFV
jgi:HAE1 family hydrophobic/amphiphilic exporter-1